MVTLALVVCALLTGLAIGHGFQAYHFRRCCFCRRLALGVWPDVHVGPCHEGNDHEHHEPPARKEPLGHV